MHIPLRRPSKLHRVAPRSRLRAMGLVAAACTALVLAACGGSGAGEVVAQVGGSTITRAAVSHWMATLAGGDYYELSANHSLPVGLVSDPPNYSACVSRLQAAAAGNLKASARLTPTNLLTKCRQINLALKIQATSYLLQAQQIISADRDEGLTVDEKEVEQLFDKIKDEQYPKEAALREYLTTRHETLADFMLVVLLDVIRQKAANKLAGGGTQASTRFAEAERRWIDKTNCSAGYVVQNCRQFKGEQKYPEGLSPAILMERVAALVTGRCTNLQACGAEL
jgi:hypothetical protein